MVDQNGTPFFYTAETSWSMLGHATLADAKRFMDERSAQGFNTIQTYLAPRSRLEAGPRGEFFEGGDVTKPNEAYFATVDELIAYAESKNLLLAIGLMWLSQNGGWSGGTAPSPEDFATYATWAGNRYKDSGNIIWVFGGDAEYEEQSAMTEAGARALRAADPNHLITYHPRSYAWNIANESWIDINSFQWNANSPPYSYEDVKKGWDASSKPVLDFEPAYDPTPCCGSDMETTPQKVRRNGWWAVLSGAMGVVYGGAPMWNEGGPHWDYIDRPAAHHTVAIKTILEGLPWETLQPDFENTVVKGDNDSAIAQVVASVSTDRSTIVAFTPEGWSLEVDLSTLGEAASARWYDPTTGEPSGEALSISPGNSQSFASPGNNAAGDSDWVLVITTGATSPTPTTVTPTTPTTVTPTTVTPTTVGASPEVSPSGSSVTSMLFGGFVIAVVGEDFQDSTAQVAVTFGSTEQRRSVAVAEDGRFAVSFLAPAGFSGTATVTVDGAVTGTVDSIVATATPAVQEGP